MKQRNCYLLSIDLEQYYDTDILVEKLNKAIDWMRIVPGTFLIISVVDYKQLYSRFKNVLPNNRFFISKLDVSKKEYCGWLPKSKWKWIEDRVEENKRAVGKDLKGLVENS